jgi:ribosomal protein S18 acetylase RimI-like enzyme
MAIVVRNAREEELDTVADVMVAAYAEYLPPDPTGPWLAYREEIRDVRSRLATATLIVADEHGTIAGAVTYYADASRETNTPWPSGWAAFRLLGVHPAARGRGIGRRLTTECIGRARAAGCAAVGLHTTELMGVARAMYERLGFVRAPRFDFRPVPAFLVMAYRLDLTAASESAPSSPPRT